MNSGFRFQVTGYKKITILLLLLALNTSYLILNTFTPPPAFAQDCVLGPNKDQCPAAGILQVQQLMTRMINISVNIAFMAMTVWLVWSAIKFFITSGGDPKALAGAWSSVTWIFMGLVFMILAWLALKLVAAFVGFDVTQFCLGFPPYCA
jgi:hypothetical protein